MIGSDQMEPDYKNWVPERLLGLFFLLDALTGLFLHLLFQTPWQAMDWLQKICGIVAVLFLAFMFVCSAWGILAHRAFSEHGRRRLARQITEGVADYVTLPPGGHGLDVGCGSGALTIACAKRNPGGFFIGIDTWAMTWYQYSRALCKSNAKAEHVHNVMFLPGNAVRLNFPDETFDAVTSNYCYHNIMGTDRQALLRESLRVLKKGGRFVVHDLMGPCQGYGDMAAFIRELEAEGCRDVRLIDTTRGKFMTRFESRIYLLMGSKILIAVKGE